MGPVDGNGLEGVIVPSFNAREHRDAPRTDKWLTGSAAAARSPTKTLELHPACPLMPVGRPVKRVGRLQVDFLPDLEAAAASLQPWLGTNQGRKSARQGRAIRLTA